ncbi:hypothetical protein ACTFIW_003253 [Dictyostelium discoideum]
MGTIEIVDGYRKMSNIKSPYNYKPFLIYHGKEEYEYFLRQFKPILDSINECISECNDTEIIKSVFDYSSNYQNGHDLLTQGEKDHPLLGEENEEIFAMLEQDLPPCLLHLFTTVFKQMFSNTIELVLPKDEKENVDIKTCYYDGNQDEILIKIHEYISKENSQYSFLVMLSEVKWNANHLKSSESIPISGIDISKFKSHSTRSTLSFPLLSNNVRFHFVKKIGRWKSNDTVDTFYDKRIIREKSSVY